MSGPHSAILEPLIELKKRFFSNLLDRIIRLGEFVIRPWSLTPRSLWMTLKYLGN
jgi:hypothetical protein